MEITTAQTRDRRRDLRIVERRPSVTKIHDRWTLTLKDQDVDLVVCDGIGNFVYRDRRSGHIGRWDDHCLHACQIAEDPACEPWIQAEINRAAQLDRTLHAAIGPCAERMLGVHRFQDYPEGSDLKIAFRQESGELMLAHRQWRGKTSGIYMIRSLTGDRRAYIGESSDIIKRWLQHQDDLKSRRHDNRELQAAWDAFGSGIDGVYGFEWLVIEVLPDDVVSPQERWQIEQVWIHYIATTGQPFNVL